MNILRIGQRLAAASKRFSGKPKFVEFQEPPYR